MALWNGRFRAGLDPAALKFSSSLPVDQRLYRADIEGSLAHVAMLAKQRIIPASDAKKIQRALREIEREIDAGKLPIRAGDRRFVAEDIHMAIEARLMEKIGEVGGKLHTGRSRNDQIATDERLYLRGAILQILASIRNLQKAFLAQAEQHRETMMPGYTHLQRAQPVLLAHHLLAYVSMLDRDRERFTDCLARVNRSPLGAGALAGTSFPVDRLFVARKLGFGSVIENSIDAVSDRDVQVEFLAACATAMMHLSRFAEEIVLWSSEEWGFAEVGDDFATGSSIMPQKKNPDIAELIRGKTGRVYGNLVALLTVMKGLPLAYNRDMQEDKEPLFDSADTLAASLAMSATMLRTVQFRKGRLDAGLDLLLSTDVADYLVKKGMSFRSAHATVGAIVRFCMEKGLSLKEVSLKQYRRHSRLFRDDVFDILNPRGSIARKRSMGSTSPLEVRKSLRYWRSRLK